MFPERHMMIKICLYFMVINRFGFSHECCCNPSYWSVCAAFCSPEGWPPLHHHNTLFIVRFVEASLQGHTVVSCFVSCSCWLDQLAVHLWTFLYLGGVLRCTVTTVALYAASGRAAPKHKLNQFRSQVLLSSTWISWTSCVLHAGKVPSISPSQHEC